MASLLLQLSGRDAESEAADLRGVLADSVGADASVSGVELDRSADLVVALIAITFEGVGAAKALWDWWQTRRAKGVTVRLILEDGRTLNLATVDQEQLVIELERLPDSPE